MSNEQKSRKFGVHNSDATANRPTRALPVLVCAVFLATAVVAEAGPSFPSNPLPPPQSGNPSYSQNPTLAPFTNGITEYATFIAADGGDVTIPYTPTASTLLQGFRVTGTENPFSPIVVQFLNPVSQIAIFPNIDHVGFGWDAYQYSVYGGNVDANNVISFALLFDPVSVNEPNVSNIDQNFTLKAWSGTGPTLVNNGLTLGNGNYNNIPGRGPAGYVGYIAYFDFGPAAYQFYGFRSSSLVSNDLIANHTGELETEFSAIAAASPSPEPRSWILMTIGLGIIGFKVRRRSITPVI